MTKPELIQAVSGYIEANIGHFHEKRLTAIETLDLKGLLKRKNPYLFKAKHYTEAADLVRGIVLAHVSSNEETVFGDWLEGLAIFTCEQQFGGRKSGITGIDLELDKEGVRYLVAIKSGPNWGNSSQINKMVSDFQAAKRTLRTSQSSLSVEFVNGCCYGRDRNPYKKQGYYKYCGQAFWAFISGIDSFYLDIIKPLEHSAKDKSDAYMDAQGKALNRLTKTFLEDFATPAGAIDWPKLIRFNAGREPS